jgi:hypothetical protein
VLAAAYFVHATQITVPPAALPGQHVLQAVGLASGLAARTPCLVRSRWLQGCLEAGRSCFNPYRTCSAAAPWQDWRSPGRPSVSSDGRSAPIVADGWLVVATKSGDVVGQPRLETHPGSTHYARLFARACD